MTPEDVLVHVAAAPPSPTLIAQMSDAALKELADIHTPAHAETAAGWLARHKDRRKIVVEHYDAILAPINTLRNKVLAMKRDDLAPVERAERALAAGLVVYRTEEQAALRAQAEAARLAAQQAAEAKRAEQIAALEAAAQHAPSLTATVEALKARPVIAPPVVLPPAGADLSAVTFRQTWTAEVVDPLMLILAVAYQIVLTVVTAKVPKAVRTWFETWVGQPVSPEALTVNTAWLHAQARQFGPTFTMPGVRAVQRTDVAQRAQK